MDNNAKSLIDFHSHILPGIDDGSKTLQESLSLLNLLKEQGVTTVVATPHFYADDQSLEVFLERRQKAYEALLAHCCDDILQIRLGAEVRYYSGISHLHNLSRLCIEGTNILLLEMPMCRWSSGIVREVLDLANNKNLTLVLAHVERYLALQDTAIYDTLRRNGILMQVNASFFIGLLSRGKALHMIRRGQVHLLGSDCHGVHYRPPLIGQAVDIIHKKCGALFLEQLNGYAEALLTS